MDWIRFTLIISLWSKWHLPLQYLLGWTVDRAWGWGKGSDQGHSAFGGGWAQAAAAPPFLPCHSSLGASARPGHRLWVYFLLGSAVPWERRGQGEKEGRRNSFVSTILEPLLLPSLAWLPPSSGGTSPWARWGPRPPGCLLRGSQQVGNRPVLPHPFSTHPAAEPLSQQGLWAEAGPWLHFTDGETEARTKALVAQGHSTHGGSLVLE